MDGSHRALTNNKFYPFPESDKRRPAIERRSEMPSPCATLRLSNFCQCCLRLMMMMKILSIFANLFVVSAAHTTEDESADAGRTIIIIAHAIASGHTKHSLHLAISVNLLISLIALMHRKSSANRKADAASEGAFCVPDGTHTESANENPTEVYFANFIKCLRLYKHKASR